MTRYRVKPSASGGLFYLQRRDGWEFIWGWDWRDVRPWVEMPTTEQIKEAISKDQAALSKQRKTLAAPVRVFEAELHWVPGDHDTALMIFELAKQTKLL